MCAAVALSALRRWATGYQPGTAKSDEALVRHEVSGGGVSQPLLSGPCG